jgi:hypothetical protein
MKIYFILLLIISVCSINNNYSNNYSNNSNNYQENYYTFFKPFEIKTRPLNTRKYIQEHYIFSTYIENKDFLTKLIKILLSNTILVNLEIIFPYVDNIHIIEPILNQLNDNEINFSILPLPLIYLKNNEFKNIRSLINISNTSFYMVYNSHVYGNKPLNFKDMINSNKEMTFGTTDEHTISYKITKNFLENISKKNPNYKIEIRNSFLTLTNDLMDDDNDLNIITFIDSNPSKKLHDIIKNDYEHKVYIQELSLDLFDLNQKTNYIYNEEFIKYTEPSFLYPNNKYKTLSFTNMLLTNKYVPDKVIHIILENILKHKKAINNYLKGYTIPDINTLTSIHTLIPHEATHSILNNLGLLDSIQNNN